MSPPHADSARALASDVTNEAGAFFLKMPGSGLLVVVATRWFSDAATPLALTELAMAEAEELAGLAL